MKPLIELSKTQHKDLKFDAQAAIKRSAEQQIVHLNVAEISLAATNFPVFLMPNVTNGSWTINALTSFVPATNLFANEEKWEASYLPTSVQTYPFFLINSEKDKRGYAVGIEEESAAFSTSHGEPLFSHSGVASTHLSHVTKMLETGISNTIHTEEFVRLLEELSLLKAIDLTLHYHDNTAQNMTGLHTVDEDKLSLLSGELLEKLNRKGYLVQVCAMLTSLYQINSLIQKHNKVERFNVIKQVKFALTRDKNAN